jgi:hypothetical protein
MLKKYFFDFNIDLNFNSALVGGGALNLGLLSKVN